LDRELEKSLDNAVEDATKVKDNLEKVIAIDDQLD
jgi:hypothetical protein